MLARVQDPVGRDAELEVIQSLLEETGPRAVVVEGAPGLGKTTLWDWGVAAARGTGTTVLLSRPAERERLLPYATLGDLVGPIVDDHGACLPEVQRHALETALQRGTSDEPSDHLAVARATLGLLQSTAAHGAVLVAIDDVQWLDSPSTHALEFVVRRMATDTVRLLAARRTTRPERPPLELQRSLPPASLASLMLGPLDTTSLDLLLRTRLALALARPQLLRLERVTGGNPYYALEIARTLAAGGDLTVPSSLGAAIAERLRGLPRATRDAVLLAATSTRPTPDLVERAADTREGLLHARDLGLLEATDHRIRFTNPLLASVAYDQALPGERRPRASAPRSGRHRPPGARAPPRPRHRAIRRGCRTRARGRGSPRRRTRGPGGGRRARGGSCPAEPRR